MIWLERASSTGRFCFIPGRERNIELSRPMSSLRTAHQRRSSLEVVSQVNALCTSFTVLTSLPE